MERVLTSYKPEVAGSIPAPPTKPFQQLVANDREFKTRVLIRDPLLFAAFSTDRIKTPESPFALTVFVARGSYRACTIKVAAELQRFDPPCSGACGNRVRPNRFH
jgi:hypothetical protein